MDLVKIVTDICRGGKSSLLELFHQYISHQAQAINIQISLSKDMSRKIRGVIQAKISFCQEKYDEEYQHLKEEEKVVSAADKTAATISAVSSWMVHRIIPHNSLLF